MNFETKFKYIFSTIKYEEGYDDIQKDDDIIKKNCWGGRKIHFWKMILFEEHFPFLQAKWDIGPY